MEPLERKREERYDFLTFAPEAQQAEEVFFFDFAVEAQQEVFVFSTLQVVGGITAQQEDFL